MLCPTRAAERVRPSRWATRSRRVMLGRLLVAAAALVAVTGLAGCGSSPPDSPTVSLPPGSTSASAPVTVAPASQGAGGVASPTPSASTLSIPPYLCDATDQAQNAAD